MKEAETHIHVIPVGGGEPLHYGSFQCFCGPQRDPEEPKVVVHRVRGHDRTWREARGSAYPVDQWVQIGELK